MSLVGLLFLVFDTTVMFQSRSAKGVSASTGHTGLSRLILGVQVTVLQIPLRVLNADEPFVGRIGFAGNGCHKIKHCFSTSQGGLALWKPSCGVVCLWCQILRITISSAKSLTINLVTSLAVPFLNASQPNDHYLHRLVVIFLTFSPIFIILTISYEGLFYVTFYITLVTWVRLERQIYASRRTTTTINSQTNGSTPRPNSLYTLPATGKVSSVSHEGNTYRALTLSDARIALFFLFLLQSAFFSTGNIASVSSFSLDSVYRLIPVFSPFSQGALLVLKLMIPFALISANLGILNRRLGVAPSALFMVVMAISDVLTLNFFFMVRDEGSWLDIGTSISHFCIASLLSVFVAGLEFVSKVFVSGVRVDYEWSPENQYSGSVEHSDKADKIENGNGNITAHAGSST